MAIRFDDNGVKVHRTEGHFGLEKEMLRVTPEGFLAHTKHPFPEDPHIDRDFCENQVELITAVTSSTKEVWKALADLQIQASKTLLHLNTGKEFLWPFSNPPYVRGEKDIAIAKYRGEQKYKERYREYLAAKYGKFKVLFSGIHFNFSFSEDFLQAAHRQEGGEFRAFKDRLYLDLAQKVVRHSWLIVYLTAASPVMDGSFFEQKDTGRTVLKNLASPRCSDMGYWNDFSPVLNYDSLDGYVDSIEAYVKNGQLREATELYYPVRLKPRGVNTLTNLRENGIDHIEFRMLDLNPLDLIGICQEDLDFLHYLILYFASTDTEPFTVREQIEALKNEKRAARFEPRSIYIVQGWNLTRPVRDAALQVLSSMERFYTEIDMPEAVENIRFQQRKIFHPEDRYAEQVRNRFGEDYVKKGIILARAYAGGVDQL